MHLFRKLVRFILIKQSSVKIREVFFVLESQKKGIMHEAKTILLSKRIYPSYSIRKFLHQFSSIEMHYFFENGAIYKGEKSSMICG